MLQYIINLNGLLAQKWTIVCHEEDEMYYIVIGENGSPRPCDTREEASKVTIFEILDLIENGWDCTHHYALIPEKD